MTTPQPHREAPPLFRHTGPSDAVCSLCRGFLVKLLGLAADWFACPKCDAP